MNTDTTLPHASVHRIANEILGLIFDEATSIPCHLLHWKGAEHDNVPSDDTSRALGLAPYSCLKTTTGPWVLIQVCRRWRNVGISLPTIWANVVLPLEDRVSPNAESLLGTYLGRSQSTGLHVQLGHQTPHSAAIFSLPQSIMFLHEILIRMVVAQINRWLTAEIDTSKGALARMGGASREFSRTSLRAPILRQMRLYITDSYDATRVTIDAPLLRDLHFVYEEGGWSPYNPHIGFCWEHLQSLQVFSWNYPISEPDLLAILTHCPGLEELGASCSTDSASNLWPPALTLHHLKSLRYSYNSPFIRHLTLPALVHVTLLCYHEKGRHGVLPTHSEQIFPLAFLSMIERSSCPLNSVAIHCGDNRSVNTTLVTRVLGAMPSTLRELHIVYVPLFEDYDVVRPRLLHLQEASESVILPSVVKLECSDFSESMLQLLELPSLVDLTVKFRSTDRQARSTLTSGLYIRGLLQRSGRSLERLRVRVSDCSVHWSAIVPLLRYADSISELKLDGDIHDPSILRVVLTALMEPGRPCPALEALTLRDSSLAAEGHRFLFSMSIPREKECLEATLTRVARLLPKPQIIRWNEKVTVQALTYIFHKNILIQAD